VQRWHASIPQSPPCRTVAPRLKFDKCLAEIDCFSLPVFHSMQLLSLMLPYVPYGQQMVQFNGRNLCDVWGGSVRKEMSFLMQQWWLRLIIGTHVYPKSSQLDLPFQIFHMRSNASDSQQQPLIWPNCWVCSSNWNCKMFLKWILGNINTEQTWLPTAFTSTIIKLQVFSHTRTSDVSSVPWVTYYQQICSLSNCQAWQHYFLCLTETSVWHSTFFIPMYLIHSRYKFQSNTIFYTKCFYGNKFRLYWVIIRPSKEMIQCIKIYSAFCDPKCLQ